MNATRYLTFLSSLLAMTLLCSIARAATITYTYDAQHRLVQASYSVSEKTFYNYDAAGNVDQHITITDAKYLQSWLWYFSLRGFPDGRGSAFLALLAKDTVCYHQGS